VSRPAAFLDRDGTIIHDVEYIRDPSQVTLVPGAAPAIRRLNDARVPVIIVTNQSGIARGWLTVHDYDVVQERLNEVLREAAGAWIDASYMCPHHPDLTGPCECRKPGPLLFQRAAHDLDLDLSRSAYIGDRWRDIAPATRFGGLGIAVAAPSTPPEDRQRFAELAVAATDGARRLEIASSLDDAVTRFLEMLPAPSIRQ
jgi:histidinol-phosphate phosphatase family protein